VAVPVGQQTPLVVLDEGDRIVGVGQGAESRFGPLLGEIVWDCYPGLEALFKPHYDAARTSGEHVEFAQFYDGNVLRVRAVPGTGGRLEAIEDVLAAREHAQPDPRARAFPRASLSAASSTA
jgi:hypothetical protein